MAWGTYGSRLRRSGAFGALLSALAVPAFAQQATTDQVVQIPQTEEETDETATRVVVTGTRLQSDSFNSPSPMTVIQADEAAVQGINSVAGLLQTATVAAGSSQVTSAQTLQFVTNGGLGTETLSLRGLGATRTLVLLDGRRAGPAGTRGSTGPFDLNVVPLSAIERVEVLKDGASSIYGSDAIAGVVNLITKKDTGGSLDFFYSQPEQSGGEELRISGTYGADFDRGYFRISGDYFKREELARGDRDFFACGQSYSFRPDGSRADYVDPRTGDYTCRDDVIWGHNWVYDYATNPLGAYNRPWTLSPMLMQYDHTGTMAGLIPAFGPGFESASGIIAPPGWYPVGYYNPDAPPDPVWDPFALAAEGIIDYFHPFQNLVSLSPEVERISVIASGEFDLTDSVQLYGEALFNRRKTYNNSYTQFWTFQYQYTYGYGYTYGDQMAADAGWNVRHDGNPYAIGHSPTAITDHADDDVEIDYMRFVAGIRGDLGETAPGWQWDASVQFSRSEGTYTEDVFWQDAIRPYYFRGAFGRPQDCNDRTPGGLTVNRQVPCVNINWYSPDLLNGVLTAEERNFLTGTTSGDTLYEQMTAEAYITGDLFDLPAGPLGVVFGLQYQEDKLDDNPSQERQDGWILEEGVVVRSGRTAGTDFTRAAFMELAIPVIKDVPAIKSFDLSLSGRYTDVASYGGASTYKAGFNWEVTDWLRFRGSKGTSFRTPALFELYLAGEVSGAPQSIDPCANWAQELSDGNISQVTATNCQNDTFHYPGGIGPTQLGGGGIGAQVITSGGIGSLTAEDSDANTFGVVWTPGFADLQVSIDYYDIEVSGQVGRVSNAYILTECYEAADFPNSPYCALFTRTPPGGGGAGQINTIFNNYLNISAQTSRGVDFEALYKTEIPWGDLTVQLQASRQLEDGFQVLPGTPFIDGDGEAGEPPWVGNISFVLEKGPWSLFWGTRYVDATSEIKDYVATNGTDWTTNGGPAVFDLATEPVFYHNASVSWEFDHGIDVRFGVSNIFDQEPPKVSQAAGGSGGYARVGNAVIESQYDLMGRTYFVNATKSF